KDSASPFREVIEKEALDAVNRTTIAKAHPIHLPRYSRILPILFLGVMSIHMISVVYLQQPPDRGTISAGELIENFGITLAARANENDSDASMKIAREMEKIGKLLQQRKMDQQTIEKRLSKISEEIERQIAGISRRPNYDTADQDSSDSQDPPGGLQEDRTQGITGDDINQLRQNLKQFSSLTNEEADFLDKTEEALENGKAGEMLGDDDSARLNDLLSRDAANQRRSALESASEAIREAERTIGQTGAAEALASESKGEDIDAGDNHKPGSGERRGTESDGGTGMAGPAGESRSPGSLAVEDESTDDFEQTAESSATMLNELDGTISGSDQLVTTVVRNLPEESFSLIDDEEQLNSYVREVEKTISQENIPVALRGYIRDYFLRIGMQEKAPKE
ncbi:MAG: hypothetical protein HN368_08910, partial [Spirochaetales bacterium]|nr:hypothetical protein [Spirochaetales bacterium]